MGLIKRNHKLRKYTETTNARVIFTPKNKVFSISFNLVNRNTLDSLV